MNYAYALDSDGSLALREGGLTLYRIPADGSFSLLCDIGTRIGIGGVLKHGPTEPVQADYKQMLDRFNALRFNGGGALDEMVNSMATDLKLFTLPVASLTPEAVEEINACIHTTGRVSRLEERLPLLFENPPNAAAGPS